MDECANSLREFFAIGLMFAQYCGFEGSRVEKFTFPLFELFATNPISAWWDELFFRGLDDLR